MAVKRVIDGDTIELVNGEMVRYLGIDAPEMRRKVHGRWIESSEPYAAEATALNRRLVEGQPVRLELDRESRDRYHRLLAYVFVKDHLVNAELISSGYVQVRLHPPNLRYAELFMKLQAEALAHHRGLWTSEGRKSTP
jgi:micrococcal nuclease